jgi:hypothetical protein
VGALRNANAARLGQGVSAIGLLLVLAGAAEPALAQGEARDILLELQFDPAPSFTPHCAPAVTLPRECFRLDSNLRSDDLNARAPDHRYEGMAIGGGIGAVLGVLLGVWACQMSEDPDRNCATSGVVGGLGGAVLVGFVGMMVGAQFPKGDKEEPAPRDSVPQ